MLNSRGSPIVKAAVNGRPVAFIVDTGAQISSVWPKQADELGLESQFKLVRMRGTGGETSAGVAVAKTVGLGSATASNIPFVTVGSLFDGHTIDGLPVIGLFGADFLSNYDVVFDLPDHKINLYKIHGCKGAVPGWREAFYKVKVERGWRGQAKIVVQLKLNGHPIDAFLDSGAGATLISRDDALDAGVKESDFAQDRRGFGFGIDDEKKERFLHRFDSLEFGPFHFNNPVLSVGETGNSLLGAEFLRNHAVWIPEYGDWIFIQTGSVPSRDVTPSTPAAMVSPSQQ